VRAEDAERANEVLRGRANAAIWISVAGIVMTAAKIIYDFLK